MTILRPRAQRPTPVILAVDQGTTSVRASIVRPSREASREAIGEATGEGALAVVAAEAEAVDRAFPAPGWVELDADAVVAATERVAARALASSGHEASAIAGIGLANQGETVVVWERATGRPIAPAIVWQCRRTEALCARLREDAATAAWVQRATGLPIDPYFSATKIAWILDHVPGARARAERGELCAGTLDTFTLFRLSSGRLFVTDPSTACRTLLADLATGWWSNDLCDLLRVPRGMLAEVVPSDADLGPITIGGVVAPVRGLLCDQPSALLGTGCLAPGDVKCTYGTGAFVQVSTGGRAAPRVDARDDGLLRSIAWQLGGERTYLLEGSVLAAGDVITWLRDGLALIARPDEIDAILRSTPDSAGVLFAPVITGLGAPRWSGDARGTILGLHRGATREHLVRAAIEGLAHQVADVLDAARSVLGGSLAPMWADGGVAASDAFLALSADVAGHPLRRADAPEATTRGVAAVAAHGAGLVASIAEAVAPRPSAEPATQASGWFEPTLAPSLRKRARDRHAKLLDLVTSEAALALTRAPEESAP